MQEFKYEKDIKSLYEEPNQFNIKFIDLKTIESLNEGNKKLYVPINVKKLLR